jgi:NADPH2:quinone reductase
VNLIETYFRKGVYPVAELPAPIGSEVVGVVDAVGEGPCSFKLGDRVGTTSAVGAYGEYCVAPR